MADLHLGFEFELVEKGINLPSQTGRIKGRVLRLLEEVKPEKLIILGDLKHTIPKVSLQEWRDIPEFLEAVREAVRHYYSYLIRRYREGTLYRLKEISDKLEEKREVQKQ